MTVKYEKGRPHAFPATMAAGLFVSIAIFLFAGLLPQAVLAKTAVVANSTPHPAAEPPSPHRNAQTPLIVVELFTSQGCSSCPPADALLREIGAQEDILALSLSVTYWDYLGWRDTLAAPEHTARQRSYAERINKGEVYTPQMIIDGMDLMVGSDQVAVVNSIAARRAHWQSRNAARPEIEMSLSQSKLTVDIAASHEAAPDDGATLWLMPFSAQRMVTISAGENRNRVLTYHHPVANMREIGEWQGDAVTHTVRLNDADVNMGEGGWAVILQQGKTGPVIAAARIFAPGITTSGILKEQN